MREPGKMVEKRDLISPWLRASWQGHLGGLLLAATAENRKHRRGPPAAASPTYL